MRGDGVCARVFVSSMCACGHLCVLANVARLRLVLANVLMLFLNSCEASRVENEVCGAGPVLWWPMTMLMPILMRVPILVHIDFD